LLTAGCCLLAAGRFLLIYIDHQATSLSAPENPIPELYPDTAPAPPIAVPPPPTRTRGENPPWTLLDVFLLGAVAVACTAIVLFLGIGIAKSLHPAATVIDLSKNPKVLVSSQFTAYLLILGGMIAFLRSRGLRFWSGVRWNWPSNPVLYVVGGILLSIAVQMLSSLLPIPKKLPIDQFFSDLVGAYIMAVFGLTMAPLLEELFFRGFFYPALSRPLGIPGAVVITSIVFACMHAGQLASAWGPLLLLFVVSVALTVTRIRLQSVAASFLVHVGYNLTLFSVMWFATDHFRHMEKLK
jgi:membrane protease YdiL (CAAX protease family)